MKKLCIIMIILLLCAVTIISCAKPATAPAPAPKPAPTPAPSPAPAPAKETPKYGGTMKLILEVSPGGNIGWPPEYVGEAGVAAQICYDGLAREYLKGNVEPWLATSWEIAPDKLSVTFKLRQGVKFHDGTDFNADAVKFNYDARIAAKLQPYWKSVEVIDPYTVKVNLTEWRNTHMSGFGAPIVSPTAFNKNGIEWMRKNPVGTGPFVFDSFQQDVSFKGVKNKNYWQKDLPYLDAFQIVYVADQNTQKALMQTMGGDALVVGLKKQAADLKAMGLNVITQAQAVNSLVPDSANPNSPFANQKVREAVEYAIDREAIATGLGFGLWKAPYQITPRENPFFDPNFVGRKYDPAKAKQLLAEAGYPNGFKTKLIPSPTASFNPDVNVAVQSYLNAVGIQTDIDAPEYSKYLTYRNGKWENALLLEPFAGWANYNQSLAAYFLGLGNTLPSLAKSEALTKAVNESATSLNPDAALIGKCVKQAFNDCTVIPVFEGGKGYAMQNYMKGKIFIQLGFPTNFITENAWLDK